MFLETISNYTIDQFRSDLVLVGIAYGYVLITILIPVYLKKINLISKFTARKVVHLFTGLVVLIVPFFNLAVIAVFIALSMTVVVYYSSRDSSVKQLQELYESISEQAEESVGRLQGPFHYSVSITLLIAVFSVFAPDRLYFPICGILIMIISDTFASLIGKKYGKINISLSYTGSKRTLEGSIVFFVTAFILCFSAFYFYGLITVNHQQELTLRLVFAYSFVTGFTGTVVELLSPSTYDDLTVPVATTMVIYVLALVT